MKHHWDPKVLLSTLWIFAIFNYLYADVFSLYFNPGFQKDFTEQLATGNMGGMQMTQALALVYAVLMETAMAMVLLSRVLDYTWNRWANIGLGAFHTVFVAWSLAGVAPNLFYAFFAAIEIACTVFIAGYAWRWSKPEVQADTSSTAASRLDPLGALRSGS